MGEGGRPLEILTRDLSSGRVHKRYLTPNGYLTLEGDNLDQAGKYEVITAERLSEAEPEALCANCFPKEPDGPG